MIDIYLKKIKKFLIPCEENEFRPGFMEGNLLSSLLVAFFVLRVIFLPFYLGFSKSSFFAQVVSDDIISLLNNQRVDEGLSVLEEDPLLEEAARLKAEDMLENNYFAHNSPQGKSPWSFIKEAGYTYNVAGENLAIGFLDSSEVYEAWNNSPLHKRNLLDSRFEEVGIAVVNGDYKGGRATVVVQMLGRPVEAKPAPTESPIEEPSTEEVSDQEPVQEEVAPAQDENIEEEAPIQEETSIQETDDFQIDGVVDKKKFKVLQGGELIPSLEFSMIKFFIRSYDGIVRNSIFVTSGVLFGIITLDLSLILFTSSLGREEKLVRLQSFALKGASFVLDFN